MAQTFMPAPASALIQKLRVFIPLSDAEQTTLRTLAGKRETFADGTDFIAAGDRYSDIYLVEEGWAIRYKLTPEGERVITSFLLPGDFICINAPLFDVSDHAVTAITEVVAARITVENFLDAARQSPKFALAVAWCSAKEEAVIEEHLLGSAKRSARTRLAHLLIELWRRLEILELTNDGFFPLPLTQQELADGLGLSPWYLNRILRAMHREGLISMSVPSQRYIRILDRQGLIEAAGFEEGYLHFTEVPAITTRALNQ